MAGAPGNLPANAVRLNSNENLLGPSRAALEAMQKLGSEEGRYAFQLDKALRFASPNSRDSGRNT